MNQFSMSTSLAILAIFTAAIFAAAFAMVNRRTSLPA
jgi:hypothetical protein